MYRFCSLLLLATLFFFACKQDAARQCPRTNLRDYLPGTWHSVSLHVTVHSPMGKDTTLTIDIPEGQWEEKTKVKPYITTFLDNNLYSMEFRNSKDSLIDSPKGIWNTKNDTLTMVEAKQTYQYKLCVGDKQCEFSTLLDWDGDGKADDEYVAIQKKVK
ncbi:MAG: hypothetical protein RLZZ292_2856 [Bacteroidota bacterium]|jgi:ferredoxin